ncbi:MAG: glycosyltransferase family 2 protein [Nitrospiraceae bacterium]|nr:glycosyltransferase family 2 protein [Nitrospiraceae bacterium]MDA8262059.1 glycosyltransferase family 2 protein [Actinomycetota bacterium]
MSGQVGPGPAITAVVVNYNAGDLLRSCVSSLFADGASEVVVVDNASEDDSLAAAKAEVLERYPTCHLEVIQTGANLGFGRAVNIGAQAAGGELLAICNPDCSVTPGALGALAAFLAANPAAGVVAPTILDSQGGRYPSIRRFPSLWISALHASLGLVWPSNPASRYYRSASEAPLGGDRWASGAFLMLPRRLFLDIGGFDDRYFMFLEDVELCRRLIRKGYQIGYEPEAVVVHHQGRSSVLRPYFVLAQHSVSLWRYADQTLEGPARLALPLVAAGAVMRLAIGSLRVAAKAMKGSPR